MKKRIDKYISKSSVIKIYVDVEGDEDEYGGIPIRCSKSLLAFCDLHDFRFDGIRTVNLKYVTKIRRGQFEVVQQKILQSTGELKNFRNPDWLRIGSWKSLLSCMKDRGLCACVASGLLEVNVFVIGEIHTLKDDAVVLNSFDAHGKWHKPKREIKYSDITEVQFGDEYSVTFYNYVMNNS